MPKVTMTFQLPEENAEYRLVTKAGDWSGIVYVLATELRNYLRHGHSFKTADEALQAVSDLFWAECNDRHVDPYED